MATRHFHAASAEGAHYCYLLKQTEAEAGILWMVNQVPFFWDSRSSKWPRRAITKAWLKCACEGTACNSVCHLCLPRSVLLSCWYCFCDLILPTLTHRSRLHTVRFYQSYKFTASYAARRGYNKRVRKKVWCVQIAPWKRCRITAHDIHRSLCKNRSVR